MNSTGFATTINLHDNYNSMICPNRYNTAGRVSKEVYSGDSVCDEMCSDGAMLGG